MKPEDRRLVRHLVIAVTLKLLLLSVLWWAFVRDHRVVVDPAAAAAHVAGLAAVAAGAQR